MFSQKIGFYASSGRNIWTTLQTARVGTGNFPTIDTNIKKWGTTSAYFNGTNNVSIWATGNTGGINAYSNIATGGLIPIGTNSSFTVEMWIYMTAAMLGQQRNFFDGGANNLAFGIQNTNKIYMGLSNVTFGVVSSGSISADTWTHICCMRLGTANYVYINGSVTSGASYNYLNTNGTPWNNWNQPLIGGVAPGTQQAFFYMQDFRVSNDAIYSTSGFTAPTAPLTNLPSTNILIPCYDGTIQDNSLV